MELTAFGETKTLSEWEKDPRCKVSRQNLYNRVKNYGWEPEFAITRSPSHTHGGPVPEEFQAFGESKTVSEWVLDERCIVPESTLRRRMAAGIGIEEAMTSKKVKR